MGQQKRYKSELYITLVLLDTHLKMPEPESPVIATAPQSALNSQLHDTPHSPCNIAEQPKQEQEAQAQHSVDQAESYNSHLSDLDNSARGDTQMAEMSGAGSVEAETAAKLAHRSEVVQNDSSDANVQDASSLQVADTNNKHQMSLQELCRDIQLSFKQNSLGFQKSLGNIDSRMSHLEKMQFLIRKQSQDMTDLKLRMAEAENRFQHDQKQLILYKRKIKELSQKIREMELKEEVRARTEREVERREIRRSDQLLAQMRHSRRDSHNNSAPQIVTVPQPVPVIMNMSPSGPAAFSNNSYQQQQQQQQAYFPPQPDRGYPAQRPAVLAPPSSTSPVITELPDVEPSGNPVSSRRQSVASQRSVRSKVK